MKRAINVVIAVFLIIIAVLLLWDEPITNAGFPIMAAAIFVIFLAIFHLVLAIVDKKKNIRNKNVSVERVVHPESALTELVLLGDDDNRLTSWNIYGQNGIVIGRDVGENNVTVDLNNCAYSSMIDLEHSVLNYSGDCWYIEDISEKNGVSIQKKDGRKYKLAYGKPCRLERGDIIYIALTRLQIL
ncbi:MAG: FHA domain-containing protein [Lachnospiraceae bacterium]